MIIYLEIFYMKSIQKEIFTEVIISWSVSTRSHSKCKYSMPSSELGGRTDRG